MEKVLTVIDVAKLLSLSPITVYRLAKKGEIPAMRVGRCWRFTTAAIEKWLAGKSWEQKLDNFLDKIWKRTLNTSAGKLKQEIAKAVAETRLVNAKNHS